MDTNVTTLSDAIILAERIQYADDFIRTGYRQTTSNSKPSRGSNTHTPMDIDTVRASTQSGTKTGKQKAYVNSNAKAYDKPKGDFICYYCGK